MAEPTTNSRREIWISTGRAARMLGYKSRDGFRIKFLGVVPAMRLPSGHYRWSYAALAALRDKSVVIF